METESRGPAGLTSSLPVESRHTPLVTPHPPTDCLFEALRLYLGRGRPDVMSDALARTDAASLLETADRAYAAPLLYEALRRAGLLERLPTPVQGPLHQVALKNAARKSALKRALSETVTVLSGIGVPALALKGAALETIARPGPRVMSDLDLMLRLEDVAPAVEALCRSGYRFDRPASQCDSYRRHFYHLAPLLSPDGLAIIELHTAPWGKRTPFPCPVKTFWSEARPSGSAGGTLLVPSWRCMLLHTAIHDGYVHPLNTRLRRCWDLALLVSPDRSMADWESAWRLAKEIKAARVLAWTLTEAADEGVLDLPAPVRSHARRLTPRVARLPPTVSSRGNRLAQALVRASLVTDPRQRALCFVHVLLPPPADVAVQVGRFGAGGYLTHLLSLHRIRRAWRALRELFSS